MIRTVKKYPTAAMLGGLFILFVFLKSRISN